MRESLARGGARAEEERVFGKGECGVKSPG